MRYIAHITIQAKTPLKVGSNESSFFKDAPIQKDWNNLPMILGTSIVGVLRREFEGDVDEVFGMENGSRVIISNALLLDEELKVNETLLLNKSDFLKNFENLSIREHTAITHKGVTKEHSKFDEEVVFKGARFKFSIEIDNENDFKQILDSLVNKTFRLGGGSTKGYGEVEIVEIKTQSFDDTQYIKFQNSLNFELKENYTPIKTKKYDVYTLKLKPDDFFIFGSGFSDEDADMVVVKENVIVWDNDKPKLKKSQIVIPASSIKGAISHRVAFYYNKQNDIFADKMSEVEFNEYQEEKNKAIMEIFGHKKDGDLGEKGKVLLNDCFKFDYEEKVFKHVAIDRFTGGAMDGALFQEKVSKTDEFEIEIVLREEIKYLDIFEKTLKDICEGRLPLGGMTTKGYGFFSGKLLKNGVEI